MLKTSQPTKRAILGRSLLILLTLALCVGWGRPLHAQAPFELGLMPIEQQEESGPATATSLGIESGQDTFSAFIRPGAPLPYKAIQRFSTAVDDQPSIIVHLLTGDDDAVLSTKNTLGWIELKGYQPGPAGGPKVDVAFEIDQSGLVKVTAIDVDTGQALEIAPPPDPNAALAEMGAEEPEDGGLILGVMPVNPMGPDLGPVTDNALGLTVGGSFTPLIDKGAKLPTRNTQVFSTAANDQPRIPLNLSVAGDDGAASSPFSRIYIDGYALGPAGGPQALLIINVDEGGQVRVWAKDAQSGQALGVKKQ